MASQTDNSMMIQPGSTPSRARRSGALILALGLAVGGLSLSPLLPAPPAQADAWTQDRPGVDTTGASLAPNPGSLGWVAVSSQNPNIGTVAAVDRTALYGIDGAGTLVGNVAKISTVSASRQQQFAIGSRPTASAVEQMMIAADSGAGAGQEGFYAWYRGPRDSGANVPANHFELWYYAPGDSAPSQVYFVPDMGYFNFSSTAWSSGGGAVNQTTGMIYLKMGLMEFLGPQGAMRLSIFDPQTRNTYWSGQLKPATASDDLWLGSISASTTAPGYVAPGLAVTATGDFLLLVRGTDVPIAAGNPINTTGHDIPAGAAGVSFLVRVHPSFGTADWTYSVVKMVTKNPSDSSGRTLEGTQWGLAYSDGLLYAQTNNSLFEINPVTGYWRYVGQIDSGGTVPPQPTAYLFTSLSSAQIAAALRGQVTNDKTGAAVPGVTVGLYEQVGGGSPQLIGSTVTDGSGNYTFVVPDVAQDGSVNYLVRLVQPAIAGQRAVITAGSVVSSTAQGLENGAKLVCANGSTIVGAGNGSLVSGACRGVTTDPPLESVGTSVDPTSFGSYGVATMRNDWSEPEISFRLAPVEGVVDPDQSDLTVTGSPATVGDTVSATATIRDGLGNGLAGQTVSFSVDGTGSFAAPDVAVQATTTCVTGDGTTGTTLGVCSVTLTDIRPQTVNVAAEVAGSPIGSKSATFLVGPPVPGPYSCDAGATPGTNVSADPTTLTVEQTSAVRALVTDKYCNPVTGIPLHWAVSSGSAVFSAVSAPMTDADGVVTATLSDHVAEVAPVTATFTYQAVDHPAGAVDVTFTTGCLPGIDPGCVYNPEVDNDHRSQVVVTVDDSPAGGAVPDVVTAKLFDLYGNPVSTAVVTSDSLAPALVIGTITAQGAGVTTIDYTTTSTATAHYQARVYANGHDIIFIPQPGSSLDTPAAIATHSSPVTLGFVDTVPPIGPVDPARSTFDVQPRTVDVNGTVTATVTLRDANNQPVPGVTVSFTVAPSTSASFTPATAQCVSSDGLAAGSVAGQCQVTLTDSRVETVDVAATVSLGGLPSAIGQPIAVQFGHGPVSDANSSWGVSPTTTPAGSNVKVTLTLKDAADRPIDDLRLSDFTVTGQAAGLPDAVVANFANLGGGVYTFDSTSTKAGTFTYTAVVTGVGLTHPAATVSVRFIPGDVCVSNCQDTDPADQTRFELGIDKSYADNVAANTIIAYAFDTYGNAVPNASFTLTDQTSGATAGHLNPATITASTGADGTATTQWRSLVAGGYTVAGTFATPLGDLEPRTGASSVAMSFVPTDAVAGTITIEQLDNLVGTTTFADISSRDAQGNLVGGIPVHLTGSSPNLSLGTCLTSNTPGPDYGTCRVAVTARLAGGYTVSATIGGNALTGSPAPVNFYAGPVCFSGCTPVDPANLTHVLVTTDGALADGAATDVVTAWAYDKYGNPVERAATWSTPLNAPALTVLTGTPAAPVETDAAGVAQLTYRSTSASAQQATVLIQDATAAVPTEPTDPSGPSPVTLNFAAGLGDPAHSTVEIAPTTPQPVDSDFTITATVHDSTDNPVGGVVVHFAPDAGLTMSDAVSGTPALSCVTGDGLAGTTLGVCRVTVTSTIAQSYQVTATMAGAGGSAVELQGSPLTASFTPGPICVAPACQPDPGLPDELTTGVAMTTQGVAPDGVARDVATARAYDRHGNAITGAVFHAATTDPITIVQPIGLTVNGTTQIYFTSTTAGQFAADVTVDNAAGVAVTVPGSPLPVIFGTGLFDPGQSSFTVTPKLAGTPTPLTVGVDPVNSYTLTATTKDATGQPAAGVYVVFSLTPAAGPTWAVASGCTTAANGTCSVDVYSRVAGTYQVQAANGPTYFGGSQPAIWKADAVCAVGCTPDPSADLFSHVEMTTPTATADGYDQAIATVYTYDKWGNPVPSVVVKATAFDADLTTQSGIAPTRADGTTTIWFTSTKADVHQAHITVDTDDKDIAGGNPASMTFLPGPASPADSRLTTDATSAVVGGQVTATATIRDAQANLVPGVRVTFGTTGSATASPVWCVTGATVGAADYGTCTAQISDNVAETTTVTATIPVGPAGVETRITPTAGIEVIFGVGAVDPAHSSLTVNPTEQTAGVDVTVTVTVHDGQDNPISGLTVAQVVVTGTAPGLDDLVMRSFTDMGQGLYTFQTTSARVGTFTLAATVRGVSLTQHPTVKFVAGDVCVSNCVNTDPDRQTRFEVTRDHSLADGVAENTIKAYAFDTNGNAVANATVVLSDQTTTAGLVGQLAQVSLSPVTTGADGTAVVSFAATAAGLYTLQGTINGLLPTAASPHGAVQYLTFVPGDAAAAGSTLELDKTTTTAGSPITATVTTRDAMGSLVGGVPVELSGSPAGVGFAASCVTSTVVGADFGTCVVPFTSDFARTYQISAKIAGVDVGGNGDPAKASPQTVRFTAGPVCFANCHPVDDPTTPEDESVTHFTHVTVTTNGVLADGLAQDIVTAYAYDALGNPVESAGVSSTPLNAPRLTVVDPGTPASPALTDADGVATIGYVSTLAATGQQATVLIDGAEPTHPSGPSPVTLYFSAGQGDPGHSRVTIAPLTAQPVDADFTVTATVRDAGDNPVGGVVVSFTPGTLAMADLAGAPATSCVTGDGSAGTIHGVCQVTVTTTKAGTYQIGATIMDAAGQASPLAGSPVTAVFTAGDICVAADGCEPDPGAPATTVVMTIDGMPADGNARDVATVSAYDRHGNPVIGAVVTARPGAGETDLAVQPAGSITATNDLGQSTVWFTSTGNGAHVADFAVGGKLPNGSPLTMHFGAGVGDAGHSSFTVVPAVAGQTAPLTVGPELVNSYRVTATVKDVFDQPAPGAQVVFGIEPGPEWLAGASTCTTAADGTCSVTVSSLLAGSFNVTAKLNGDSIEQAKPATWKADGVCADDCTPSDVVRTVEQRTRFVVTRDNMVANGVQYDQVTVYARDQYGNPVPNVVVASAATPGDTSLVVGPALGTNDQGVAVLNYATVVAGAHTATITADGHPVADAAGGHNRIATVNFVAGPADPAKSTLEVNPTTSPAGTAVTATLTARDVQSNLVPTVTATLAVTGSASLTPGVTCVTGATVGAADYGQCQVSVNDRVVETVTVTATIPVGTPAVQRLVTPTAGVAVVFTNACLPGIDPNCDYDDAVPNDHRTRVNVTVDHQSIIGGVDQAKVWVYDAQGNAVAGAAITTTTADTRLVVPSGQPALTGGDGTTVLRYTTTVTDDPLTAQAKVFVTNAAGQPVELVFLPQPGSALDNPAGIAANSSPVTLHFADTVRPAPPVITTPEDNTLTNQYPLPVSGTGEPGATVTVWANDQPVLDANGDPVTALVDAGGHWTAKLPLADGTYQLRADQTDASGNRSDRSAPVRVHIDTTPPDMPLVDSTNGSTVTGQAEPGSTVTITDAAGQPIPGCEDVVADATTGRFACRPVDKLDPGAVILVTATDEAGNTSPDARVVVQPLTVSVDKPTPNPGEVVTVTAEHFNPGETVTITLCSACQEVGSAVADASGKVVVLVTVPAGAVAGPHTITATGAVSGAASTGITVVVAPKAPTGGAVVPNNPAVGLLAGWCLAMLAALVLAGRRWALRR